jgi:predicted nuclease of restriction endonuclease-like RecB superfamily
MGFSGFRKFGNKKTNVAGHWFDSKLEASFYQELLLREKAQEISDIKSQVAVYLTDAKILYKVDFTYQESGKTIYAEVKGFRTAVWAIKKRLWKHYGPGELRIFEGSVGRLRLVETIIP